MIVCTANMEQTSVVVVVVLARSANGLSQWKQKNSDKGLPKLADSLE